jgi:diguanylate cyclase (GGDEF)-like protein
MADDRERRRAPRKRTTRRTAPLESRAILGTPDIPVLRVTGGRDVLRFASLGSGAPVEVGRDETCGLVLTDASVSRRHARVTTRRDGFFVEDLGSSNGTLVNGVPVKESRVSTGDTLEVGTVPLRVDLLSARELQQLQAVVRRLEASDRDPLTGLLTRAYLDNQLPLLLEGHDRTATPVSAAFLDVDHFKSINDRFGHATGDDVLRQLARLLVYVVREREACIRYGGEEIVIVLPDSREDDAAGVAERLREMVEGHDWGRLADGLAVTVSSGVAERRSGEPLGEWLARADRALYAAKAQGRNRVRRASEPSP